MLSLPLVFSNEYNLTLYYAAALSINTMNGYSDIQKKSLRKATVIRLLNDIPIANAHFLFSQTVCENKVALRKAAENLIRQFRSLSGSLPDSMTSQELCQKVEDAFLTWLHDHQVVEKHILETGIPKS